MRAEENVVSPALCSAQTPLRFHVPLDSVLPDTSTGVAHPMCAKLDPSTELQTCSAQWARSRCFGRSDELPRVWELFNLKPSTAGWT